MLLAAAHHVHATSTDHTLSFWLTVTPVALQFFLVGIVLMRRWVFLLLLAVMDIVFVFGVLYRWNPLLNLSHHLNTHLHSASGAVYPGLIVLAAICWGFLWFGLFDNFAKWPKALIWQVPALIIVAVSDAFAMFVVQYSHELITGTLL